MKAKKTGGHKVPARTPEPQVGVGKQAGSQPVRPTAELLEEAIRNAKKVKRAVPPTSSSPPET